VIIRYQEECFTALHDYWTYGQATRKVMPLSAAEIEAHEIAKLDAVDPRQNIRQYSPL